MEGKLRITTVFLQPPIVLMSNQILTLIHVNLPCHMRTNPVVFSISESVFLPNSVVAMN